jgi:phage shock protein PspC (stress-responsive transcriptional regulator)
MTNDTKRLYRSEHNRSLAGVCGGLAEYFNVDATLVRLLFVIFALSGGPGLLVYIVLWLVIPTESDVYDTGRRRKRKRQDF